jgi:predicted small lipoprotein YifL
MKKNISRFSRLCVVLALVFALAGCGQTPAIILDDSANFKKHEDSIMVPEPSGESTNQGLWMDMQGGG